MGAGGDNGYRRPSEKQLEAAKHSLGVHLFNMCIHHEGILINDLGELTVKIDGRDAYLIPAYWDGVRIGTFDMNTLPKPKMVHLDLYKKPLRRYHRWACVVPSLGRSKKWEAYAFRVTFRAAAWVAFKHGGRVVRKGYLDEVVGERVW